MKDGKKTIEYLKLSMIPGLGPVSQNRLLSLCNGIDHCFSASEEELMALDQKIMVKKRIGKKRIHEFINQRGSKIIDQKAEEILRESEDIKIAVITEKDKEYPDRFFAMEDRPILLYAKGNLIINTFSSSVGVIGARRCTSEGKIKAIETTVNHVQNGAAIISGMAKGVDSYAHTAALKSDGYTIAVLGSGVDLCYPGEHRALYELIAQKGCLLSEYPPGTHPATYRFPQRNRLIAALSDTLYVIDAGRHSGTESTVAACNKYGREVKGL